MSLSGHVLPVMAVLLLWFASTALIMWLAHRPRATFAHALVGGAVVGVAGVVLMIVVAGDASATGACLSFAGAVAVWGWHELAFLTGAVTGPRRAPYDPASPQSRFGQATAAVIHHEVALFATMLLLFAVSWGAANQTGAWAFALLWLFRLTAKLNIYHGVPNLGDDLMPPHFDALKTYFGPRRIAAPLALTIVAALALTFWLALRAGAAADEGATVAASLLLALGALGTLEHLFLGLPVKDGALWRWTIPAEPAIH